MKNFVRFPIRTQIRGVSLALIFSSTLLGGTVHAYTVTCDSLPARCNMTGFSIESEDVAPTTTTKNLKAGSAELLYGIRGGTGSMMPLQWGLMDMATPSENRWLYSFRANDQEDFRVEVNFDTGAVKALCVEGMFDDLTGCSIYRGSGRQQ